MLHFFYYSFCKADLEPITLIFDHGNTWRLVVSFTPHPFYWGQ